MADRVTDEDLDLLDELGVDTTDESSAGRSPREQRIIAGFEEIVRFVEEYGKAPTNDPAADIFERIYAVRLESIRNSLECRTLLAGMDSHGLLSIDWGPTVVREEAASSDAALLAELGVDDSSPENDITRLTQPLRPSSAIKALVT